MPGVVERSSGEDTQRIMVESYSLQLHYEHDDEQRENVTTKAFENWPCVVMWPDGEYGGGGGETSLTIARSVFGVRAITEHVCSPKADWTGRTN
jgi:hypothetical protein